MLTRNNARLLNIAEPLVIARGAVDLDHQEAERAAYTSLRQGVSLAQLLPENHSSVIVDHAATVLASRDDSARVMSYYSLKTLLSTHRQQIFGRIIFSQYSSDALRHEHHSNAYEKYGALLGVAHHERKLVRTHLHGRTLAGHIGELTVLSLLNRTNRHREGATMASATADILHRTDVLHRYIDDNNSLRTRKVQVKTNEAKAVEPSRRINNDAKLIVVNLQEVLGAACERNRIASLIVSESQRQRPLTDKESSELTEATGLIKDVIFKHSPLSGCI